MSAPLLAGPPLEIPRHRVGRSSTVLVDGARSDRVVPVDVWYPAAPGSEAEPSVYELLPGISFTAAALHDADAAAGSHPLLLWSHGRTGTRSSYALLCEALAARGFVVVAPEHGGDALADWMLGSAVDDDTNEVNRVVDARFVLDAVLDRHGPLPAISALVDPARVAVAGHSYGGFTALALAGAPERDNRVRAAAGLQSLTRTIPKQVFERIEIPTMLVVASHDATCPPETDADRAWAKLGAQPALRIDVGHAGHQACSDVGLYIDLAPQVEGLPDIVHDFIASMTADITGTAGDPWRDTVALHVRILAAFLDGALDIDLATANQELKSVSTLEGVELRQRGAFAQT